MLDRTFDGHFYLTGRINGTDVAFLVDTGASTIAIGETLAQQLDLGPCRSRQYSTAAGTVRGCEASASEVEVAGLRLSDVPVAVLPGADTVLLGMNVLRHFRIEQQGRQMRLTPVEPPGAPTPRSEMTHPWSLAGTTRRRRCRRRASPCWHPPNSRR